MEQKAVGTVIEAKKQWWLKVNKKPVRTHALDGAAFPHIIKVKYTVDGTEHIKRKWIGAAHAVPAVGSAVTVVYHAEKPHKAKILL